MKRYIILLMGILGFIPILAQQSEYYYYYKGNRIDLIVDSTRLYVVSEGEFQPQSCTYARASQYNVSHSSRSQIYNIVEPLQKQRSSRPVPEVYFSTMEIPEGLGKSQFEEFIQDVKATNGVWQALPSFLINGKRVNATNNFYVRLRSADDVDILHQMASQYRIDVVGYNGFMPLWYTLACTSSSSMNAIEAANLFYCSNRFASSKPEFTYSFSALHSDDDLYEQQWNLHNTGQDGYPEGIDINVERAWETTKGSGVVVAVFDQGVDLYHPDLRDNILSAGYDATTNTIPSVITDSSAHGTCCAGIIAAVQDNGEGISGVAPEAKILPVSVTLDSDEYTDQMLANGINWAWQNGADIISNSWGGMAATDMEMLDNAIADALQRGRGGKGCVLVFSAGNDSVEVHYPANSDSRIIAVGGITPWGNRTVSGFMPDGIYVGFNSNFGEKLDVVAPSVNIWTTDITGRDGETNMDYFGAFRGTSAACPHVSGVAALLLSVDPELTVEEVAEIIESTACKVREEDLYVYENDTIHVNGTWNNEVGYGLIDAAAAVDIAKKTAVTTYIKNQDFNDVGLEADFYDINVELENVTIGPEGYMEIYKEEDATLKSSVIVRKGGIFHIYQEIMY